MSDYSEILTKQRDFLENNSTRSYQCRIDCLKKLKAVIKANENAIIDALNKDLGKSDFEAFVTEVGIIYDEINYTIRHLHSWMKKRRVKTPLVHFKGKSFIVPEPYGVVLIISPWNYPFQLSISPLIGALAAGNTVILKPSEYSLNTTKVLKVLFKEFDSGIISVVEGDKDETLKLLAHKFDYIFFTGSVNVGKVIMEQAAKHLTPVTLELGGKSPCIVHDDANIPVASRRIMFGKLLNSGQTCVAPDYLLVHKSIKSELIDCLIKTIKDFYGNPLENSNYPKIITRRHFDRLISLLKDKQIVFGGGFNTSELKIEPTIVEKLSQVDPLLNEEIFGPILPIIEYEDLSEAIAEIKRRPKPLALYLFTNNKDIENTVVNSVSFGGGCINDTIMHLASKELPFGGVGESGMGAYHGYASFQTFTHFKSVLVKSNFDLSLRYPPYKEKTVNFIRRILK